MRPPLSKRSAFTLTELLVVIGLIGLLGTALGLALNGGKGRALTASQREIISALNVARMAVIKGSLLYPSQDTSSQKPVSALVINVDSDSPGYLREFGVVAGWRNSASFDASGIQWKAVGQPMVLPEGLYFVPSTDANSVSASSSIDTSRTRSLTYPMFTAYTPGSTNVGNNVSSSIKTPRDYYCIFFDSDGTIASQSSGSPNATVSQNIVVAAGQKTNIQSTGTFTVTFSDPGQVTGVRTVRYGNAIAITDPNDLK